MSIEVACGGDERGVAKLHLTQSSQTEEPVHAQVPQAHGTLPGVRGSAGHTMELCPLRKGPDSSVPSCHRQMGRKLARGNTYYFGLWHQII